MLRKQLCGRRERTSDPRSNLAALRARPAPNARSGRGQRRQLPVCDKWISYISSELDAQRLVSNNPRSIND